MYLQNTLASQFQSTRPRGARRAGGRVADKAGCFNPRAHVGRDKTSLTEVASLFCFNPRAHVGRDFRNVNSLQRWLVSIHAPTWGATNRGNEIRQV